MRRNWILSHLIAVITGLMLLSCQSSNHEASEKVPPYGAAEPITEAKIFGPNVISTEISEFGTAFSPDGETVYFNQWLHFEDGSDVLKIVKSTYQNGEWSTPQNTSFSDGAYNDIDPFVTHDGKRLYYSSNRPIEGTEPASGYNTWYVELTENGWSKPINPGAPINSERSEVFVSVTGAGAVYFSARNGARHIYRSEEINGQYQPPERVSLGLPDSISIGNPMISADERFIIISSAALEGEGSSDLFICQRNEHGEWGEIRNLGKLVNSPYREFAPGISPDGEYLFFTSERPGIAKAVSDGRPPGDLYQISISEVLQQ